MRPDEDEDKFDHDPDGTGWELNTSEMTPKHMRDIPRRIRCLPFDVPWSQKTADSLAEEVVLVVEMALLPPNAGADIAAKAGVNAALANLGRALKAEARIEALEDDVCLLEHALRDAVENKPCWDLRAKAMLQPINRMLDRMRRAGATPEEVKAAFDAALRGEEEDDTPTAKPATPPPGYPRSFVNARPEPRTTPPDHRPVPAEKAPTPKPPAPNPQILTTSWPADKEPADG